MKWVVYNLLFALVYPFLLPGFLVRMLKRGGYAARMGDRFALYPAGLFPSSVHLGHGLPRRSTAKAGCSPNNPNTQTPKHPNTSPIWIHAVSVGEVQVAGQLMREWRKAEPDVRFCFSTTSSTGWKMAEREVTANDTLIYNPLDFPNFVTSALRTVRPRAIVLTESEIWPNFIRKAKSCGIPLFLINARVSDRSAPRYKAAKLFFGDVLGCFTRIFAQSDLDAERLVAAGAPREKLTVTGSSKFDVARRNEAKEKELREWIFGDRGTGSGERPKIILGGSTWPGEDEVLLRIYQSILHLHHEPSPVLVIAPRHFEKGDAVEANIRAAGFDCVRRSRPSSSSSLVPRPSSPVYLSDTTGELMGLFGIADVVFVGKSLCAHGSQNMIEPCLCGKPTFVGPFTENFRPVMSDLLAAKAIVQVSDEAELAANIRAAVDGKMSDLGTRAAEAVLRRQGVVPKCVAAIREAIA
jgi:3-deoxy-D-manno-octulosonic-acid transferase